MKRKQQGYHRKTSTKGETVSAFVPSPLPPDPSIDWGQGLREKFDEALVALGRLDSVSVLLPDTSLFLYMYIRKEAVLSSQIEGTQSSLSDLLLFESEQQPGVPLDDVQEVSNYVVALEHGMKRLSEGFPPSLRLIREVHEKLFFVGRGSERCPGEFRKSQNWIGGTRPGNAIFVPPPPEYVLECMGQLEGFFHNKLERTSPLLKVALMHVQFETIHPFLDGNGRLGRLLITLLLCWEGILKEPMLYLSLYLKEHRQRYYELLGEVRFNGDWEAWLDFFADAVIDTASQAVATARQLTDLAKKDEVKIQSFGRVASSMHRIHQAMLERPIIQSVWLKGRTGLAMGTVLKCLGRLEEAGIIRESTGQKRNRRYVYTEYIDLLSQGTEPLLMRPDNL